MDNFDALKAATLGAQQIQAPTSNPLGASNFAEIGMLNRSRFQAPAMGLASQAGAANDAVTIDNQQQAAKMKIEELKQQAQDLADQNDPSKYTVKKKDDGGYDFFDPKGNQIDIATYTKKTGLKAADVLKDSDNPIDIQFRADWQNLQDFADAVVSGDSEKVLEYKTNNPELEEYKDVGGIQRLFEKYYKNYKRYYVPQTQDPSAWGAANGNTIIRRGPAENEF